MAFTAVQMELSRLVSSPVPWAFLPSSRTNLVRVSTSVSKAPLSDILLSGVGLGPNALSETGEHSPKVKKWRAELRKGKGRGCAAPRTNQTRPSSQRGAGSITSVTVRLKEQSSEIVNVCCFKVTMPDLIPAHVFLSACKVVSTFVSQNCVM